MALARTHDRLARVPARLGRRRGLRLRDRVIPAKATMPSSTRSGSSVLWRGPSSMSPSGLWSSPPRTAARSRWSGRSAAVASWSARWRPASSHSYRSAWRGSSGIFRGSISWRSPGSRSSVWPCLRPLSSAEASSLRCGEVCNSLVPTTSTCSARSQRSSSPSSSPASCCSSRCAR